MACPGALTDEEIANIIANVRAVNIWAEGGPSESATMANGRIVPSPAKVINDSKMFKEPVAYSGAVQYTDSLQPVIELNVVYAPIPSLLPIGPEAFDGAKWYVLQGSDFTTLTQANAYTDQEVALVDTAAQGYANTAEANAVVTANAYTDSSLTSKANLNGDNTEIFKVSDALANDDATSLGQVNTALALKANVAGSGAQVFKAADGAASDDVATMSQLPPTVNIANFHVDNAGTATGLPAGWSVLKNGTGLYTVTHSLGFNVYPMAIASQVVGVVLNADETANTTTTFTIRIAATNSTAANFGFNCIVKY